MASSSKPHMNVKSVAWMSGASEAKRMWYGLERCTRAIAYTVPFDPARKNWLGLRLGVSPPDTLQSGTAGTAGLAPSYIFLNIYNCYWTKKWYGHGRTSRHGSDTPGYDVYIMYFVSIIHPPPEDWERFFTLDDHVHETPCSGVACIILFIYPQ